MVCGVGFSKIEDKPRRIVVAAQARPLVTLMFYALTSERRNSHKSQDILFNTYFRLVYYLETVPNSPVSVRGKGG